MRAGTCMLQCLSHSSCRCGTFHTVTMVPLKHAAASFKGIVGVEKGYVKRSMWECVCASVVSEKRKKEV